MNKNAYRFLGSTIMLGCLWGGFYVSETTKDFNKLWWSVPFIVTCIISGWAAFMFCIVDPPRED